MGQDDAQLVVLSKNGDLSAFNAIVERYQSQVYNLSARILSDRAAAEDVAQETFISAHRAIGGFRGGSLRAWLLRIASNASYDHVRARRRRPEQSLDESFLDPGFDVPSGDRSLEQQVLSSELGREIQRGIMTLPPDQRAVLVMVDVQGLSYEEAAEAAGISVGTVKSRLSRARSRARDYLRQRKELLPDQFRHL